MKLYYTYNQLKKDLPYLKDVEIKVIFSFEQTINLDTREYQSFKAQLKRQNIKIRIETIEEKHQRNKWKYYNRNKRS